LGGVVAIAHTLGISPVRAETYEYSVDFLLENSYSVTGSINTTCDDCLLTAADALYWEFNLIGPQKNTLVTISSLSMSIPSSMNVFGQNPLYALPQGIFFNPLHQYTGGVVFDEGIAPNNGAALNFLVFGPNNETADIQFLMDVTIPGCCSITDTYGEDRRDLYLSGGTRIASLLGEIGNNFHPGPRERRELRDEEEALAATPLPPALPLFATALGGLGLLGWRRKQKVRSFAIE
jgi:hypothetical protein